MNYNKNEENQIQNSVYIRKICSSFSSVREFKKSIDAQDAINSHDCSVQSEENVEEIRGKN